MTETFSRPISLRWADFDPNVHLRHSVYYDFGAAIRVEFLGENGVTPEFMAEHHLGPVLFREEAIFRKEVRMGDRLTIDLAFSKMRRDFSRFSFRHQITRDDGALCAVIHIDGAWIDTVKRKLTTPPALLYDLALTGPKTEDFTWYD